MLKLADYENLINLRTPFTPYRGKFANDSIRFQEINELFTEIGKDIGHPVNFIANSENTEETMVLIRSYLNQREPRPLRERLLTLLDHYFADVRASDHVMKVSDIPKVAQNFPSSSLRNKQNLSLWRGDITLINADAIVNAANSAMLGCFRPMHKCIDNCIHTFASPRLREDMNKIMMKQGIEEETGFAKVTRAYNLPSKFILHTVGPIYGEQSKEESERLLESCYIQCLETAAQVSEIKSIAFCCISTGVFGFPNKDAARIAISTTDKWLSEHPGTFDRIIFNVFLKKDNDIYTEILSE